MSDIARKASMRAACLTLLALTTGLTVCRADVIQSTVALPPPLGAYALGDPACNSTLNRCTVGAIVSGFGVLMNNVAGGNESVLVSANYSADVFTDNSGVPGVFVGHLSMPGTALFIYTGRDPAVNPLGVFPTELADFDFMGVLNGNTFEVMRDPAHSSTGSTSILPITVTPPILYSVSGSLEVFSMFSFNGGPFMPAPPRTTELSQVPEPGTGPLAAFPLAVIVGMVLRRRRGGEF
jgi:hypothetical protein